MEENKKSKKISPVVSRSILISLFISMIVGSSFGFLVSLVATRHLKDEIKKDLVNGNFAKEAFLEVEQKQKELKADQQESENLVTETVANSSQAVVSIIISKDIPIIERYFENPSSGSGGWDDFFGSFGMGIPKERQLGTEKKEIGGGSGFLVSADGFIVTNKHVVLDEEAEYTVLLNDGRRFQAVVLGRDPVNDLAILKIDPATPEKGEKTDKLPFLGLGDSAGLKVGQTVIAIGNSLGEFQNTVSKGIVSGLRRNITAGNGTGQAEALTELIQTDAAINQGNSGGPLLNLKGEVVGINVAVAAGAQNVGFALSANSLKPVIESVKRDGQIVRPFIGVRYILNSEELAKANNLPYVWGALVQRGETPTDLAVIPGSPADKAGIKENDLLLEINGKKIGSDFTLGSAILDKQPGDKLQVKLWSKGEIKNTEVVLEKR
jgi:serine protease Do